MAIVNFPEGTRVRQPIIITDAQDVVINLATVTALTVYVFREQTTILTATEANGKLSITDAAAGTCRLDLEIADTVGLHGEYRLEAWGTLGGVVQFLGRCPLRITETFRG